MSVVIRQVETDKDLRDFVFFPYRLYKDSPFWVPPLKKGEFQVLDPEKNPSYRFCRARLFLAEQDGRVVGRVAGIINTRFIEKWKLRQCRLGWIDFIDDRAVSAALLAAVEEWAREEGMETVQGPLGFTNFDKAGMLVEGFDEVGTVSTIYNYAYYSEHLEAAGYRKDVDWLEYIVKSPEGGIPEKILRIRDMVLKRNKLRIVPPRKRELRRYAPKLFDLLNHSFSEIYGHTPVDPDQADMYFNQYIPLIDMDFCKIVVNPEDEVVAFVLAIPSFVKALRKAAGRINLPALVEFLKARLNPRRLELLLVGVRPDYQALGLPAILMAELQRSGIRRGVVEADANPELEDNVNIHTLWKNYEVRQNKRRRSYRKDL